MNKKIYLILCICFVVLLPFTGLLIKNHGIPKKDYYNVSITTKRNNKDASFNLKTNVKGTSTNKAVKVYTSDVSDGKGKINIELTSNDEKEKVTYDIEFDGTKWNLLESEQTISNEMAEVVNDVKENLNRQKAKQISLSYSNSYSSFKSN